MFLAAPKNFFGLCNAAGSRPPDNVFPDDGITRLYALASLVILSNRITTSLLCSIILFPEEVTDMKRSIKGQVIYSTFDEMPEHHVKVAEMPTFGGATIIPL